MMDFFRNEDWTLHAFRWAESHIFNLSILYQLGVIAACFVAGYVLSRFISPRFQSWVARSKLMPPVKSIGIRLGRRFFAIFTLITLYFATIIGTILILKLNAAFSIIVMKILLAWIITRMAGQFIANTFIRNFLMLITLTIAALSIAGILDETMAGLNSIAFSFGDTRISALAIIKGAISVFVLLYAAIFVSGLAERKVYNIKSLNRSSQVLLAKIIRVSLIVIALFIAVTSSGIDLSLFAVFGGAIGLGIGFGLQKGISNLFSGMLLLMDQSIKPGDVIELEDSQTFGWVSRMAARYTEIVTRDNKSYLIPNEDFITQRVVNWSYGNNLIRVAIEFGVHYDSDVHKVIEVAIAAAQKPDRVVEERTPVCWITEFGDSSINFTLRFWITDAEQGIANVKGQVFLALWDAFKEHGIKIPYPHREVYMHEAAKPDPA